MEAGQIESDVDVDFFSELRTVFERHPDAARKYSVSLRQDEIGTLKIDFNKQQAVSRLEGNRIVTEVKDLSDLKTSRGRCCERYFENGRWRCAKWCVV